MARRSFFCLGGAALAGVFALVLASCSNPQNNLFGMGQGEAIGTMAGAGAGAAAGGAIGKSPLAAGIGGVIGGLLGNRIGAYLDDREKQAQAKATSRAFQGQTAHWSTTNDNGQKTSGEVIPTSGSFVDGAGDTCKKMRQTVDKNGQTSSDDVTVCRVVNNGSPQYVVQNP